MRRTLILAACALFVLPAAAQARKRKRHSHESAVSGPPPNARAISELMGKYKWGMTPNECLKVIADEEHAKFAPQIAKTQDVYQQDQLRKQEQAVSDKIKGSFTKFDEKRSGWDTSIVAKEFGHNNDESMLVRWEKDQRRFLFFWHDRLYKQYIAFNAEHPVFKGMKFDDFAKLMENRYGPAQMKMKTMRTKDDVTLDHLEWPPSGDYTLWAIDQSAFYGNFSIVLKQTSVYPQVEASRKEHAPQAVQQDRFIDAVTAPDSNPAADPNSDVVDQITGRHPKGSPAQ